MEISFERGGTLPKKKLKVSKPSSFGSKNEDVENRKKKSKRDDKKKSGKDGDIAKEVHSANSITLNSLVNDMILMGIVKSIYSDRLLLALPGRLFGRVPITNISKSYSEFLKSSLDGEDILDRPKMLTEMFHVGQILYTKVLDKCYGEKEDILLSLLPEDINSEISSNVLEKGSVLLCAIQEVEDHGYFLETGVKNIRGFLPKKNVKSELKVGELLFCKVHKVSESVVTFSAFKQGEQIKIDTLEVPNIKTLLPSTIVNFNVVQLLKNGLEGLLFDGSIAAYANELYVPAKFAGDSKIIGKELKARVLYRMPLSNQLYVTLNVDGSSSDKILFGTIFDNAKVIRQTNAGVLFKLDPNNQAILTRRTIMKNYKTNFDIDTAMLKFSPNSTHRIRIMDYNEFEQCYMCTNNEHLLKEKFFCTYNLEIGQIVQGKVIEKVGDGLKLLIGNVKGFLKGILYHKTAKNDAIGGDLRVRIVEINHDERAVQVTNLQGFLRDGCKILDSKSKIKFKESFSGVVTSEKSTHFSILFFNHIRGILNKNEDTEADLISIGGLKIGTVKMFEIGKVKGDKIFLKIPKKIDTDSLGKIFECKVTSSISSSGIQIFINELKAYGKIPKVFISELPMLNDPILNSIKENTKFDVVALGNNQYSRRDVKYFKNISSPRDFNDIKPNDVVRCYVKFLNANNIELECPLRNFNDIIRLNRDAFDNPDSLSLNIGDIVYVSVIAKNESHFNSLYVTPSLPKVWRSCYESLDMLSNYLDDISFLIENLRQSEKPFSKYSIGQRISGNIKTIIGNNIIIELEENVFAQGSVENVHTLKIGSKINDAVVIWVDPLKQMLFVTTIDKCKNEISINQEIDEKLVCEKKHKSIIVYFNDYVTVCTIRKQGQPLIYVPTKQHYNDFSTSTTRALGNATSKLIIRRANNGKLLGVFVQDERVLQKIEKIKNKLSQKLPVKRKQASSISENSCEIENVKHPKVVLNDSDSENENSENLTESHSKIDLQRTFKKQAKNTLKTIGKTLRNTAKMAKPAKEHHINKDSLIGNDLVNLVSYKKLKEGQTPISIEKKSGKMMSKTTPRKKKKPKRLIKQ